MTEPPTGAYEPGSPLSRAKQIFLAVREAPLPGRGEQLDRLCAGDAALRSMVEKLLQSEAAPHPFEFLADEAAAAREQLTAGAISSGDPAESCLGSLIGPYRVLNLIGEGGFGVVYLAEQQTPVRRRVALKILKLGMDTREFVVRFEAERQALAMMDHPGIARVYDAGATSTGRPYLAMELVHGRRITSYCDERALSIPQRLAVIGMVCDAVHHAHQKGIIHRDLKPGNILVCEVDGRPSPKIIDFGIAKAISARLTDQSIVTEVRQMVGTPAYMSPEQAGDSDVDTRTDVYSLGVVLYELLSGTPPFDEKRFRALPRDEMRRVIREVDPPRPSTRLSGLRSLAGGAAGTSHPERLAAMLKGELDWIVMKCLEKDRTRRYGSVAELGADIQRFLSHKPIAARPASRAYLVRKFARRHRTGVAVAAGSALLVIFGMAGTTAGLVSAVKANGKLDGALGDVRTQRDLARTQLLQSEQLLQFLRSMLASVNPTVTRGRDTTVLRELLDAARARIDGGELASTPVVATSMRATIAQTYQAIGDNAAAIEVIEPALRLADNARPEERSKYLNVRIIAARVYIEWRHDEPARLQLDRVLEVRRLAEMPDDEQAADIYAGYALLHARQSRFDDALAMQERVVAIRTAINGESSIAVASAIGNLAGLLTDIGRREDALAKYQQSLAIYSSARPLPLTHLAIVENNMADLLVGMGRFAEAEAAARDSLDKCGMVFKPGHQQVGMSWNTLGAALSGRNRPSEARAAFQRSVDILDAAYDHNHPLVLLCRVSLARELVALARFGEAEPILLSAHATLLSQRGIGDDAPRQCADSIAQMYEQWEAAEQGRGHGQKAAEWRRRRLE